MAFIPYFNYTLHVPCTEYVQYHSTYPVEQHAKQNFPGRKLSTGMILFFLILV